jgi:hypothetical protein
MSKPDNMLIIDPPQELKFKGKAAKKDDRSFKRGDNFATNRSK